MDTMRKQIIITAILFVGLINIAHGQVFNIQSLDGNSCQVRVLPDDENNTLTIAYLKDTLHIKGFTDIKAIDVLNKSFLKIVYSIRGGSGIHLRHTLILSVSGKTLCQSLHITSLFDEEYIDFNKPVDSSNPVEKKSVYEADLNVTGNNSQSYRLDVKVHDEKKSKHAPQTNYNRHDAVALSFDTNQNIFYSTHQDVSKYFTVYDPKTQRETKQYMMGTFPVVKLGKIEYYYIKGDWYEKSINEDLSKYSYR